MAVIHVGTEHLICESKFCLTKASQASSARAAPTARRTSGRAAAAPPSWVAAHVARHVPRPGIAQMTQCHLGSLCLTPLHPPPGHHQHRCNADTPQDG